MSSTYNITAPQVPANMADLVLSIPSLSEAERAYFQSGAKGFTISLVKRFVSDYVIARNTDLAARLEDMNADEEKAETRDITANVMRQLRDTSGWTYYNREQWEEVLKDFTVISTRSSMTISEALTKMSVTKGLVEEIKAAAEHFISFGMKNSSTLRAKLMALMESNGLTPEAKFLVYFFASLIKNKVRISEASMELPPTLRRQVSVNSALTFIDRYIVQYVAEENKNNFAIVHLPGTNPGLDLMCSVLMTQPPERSIERMSERMTFSQLNLSSALQDMAKKAQEDFWSTKVLTTKNEANKTFKPEFNLRFYETSAADKYNLVALDDDGNLFELPPATSSGYTESEIKDYLNNIPSWA